MMRLYTFNISHFAEKARWALDRTASATASAFLCLDRTFRPYGGCDRARPLFPLFFFDQAVPFRDRAASSTTSTSAISDHRLTPVEPELQKQALELERWLDAEIGEAARRFFYHHALPHRELVGPLFHRAPGPWWGKMFCGLAYLEIARAIRGMYDINETTAAADAERVRVAYGHLDEMLARGPYLLGYRFTRADLTLAALTAPIWRPSEHPTRWPAEALYPDVLRKWIDELSRFRIRDHALRMYREHRRATARAAPAA